MHHDAELGDDVVELVAAHLDADDKVALRSTCRALRQSPAILASITHATVCGKAYDIDLSFVGRHMRGLRDLSLHSSRLAPLASLVPHLLGLNLRCIYLDHYYYPDEVYDLKPLGSVASLREAQLSVLEHVNLGALTQLDRLELLVTPGTAELSKLTSLRSLDFTDEGDAWHLSSLQGLTRLEYGLHEAEWGAGSLEAASEALMHMPNLRVLETPLDGEWALPSVVEQLSRLTQLSALCLHYFDPDAVGGRLDLTALSLQRLGLKYFQGELAVVSPSLTCLFLDTRLHTRDRETQVLPDLSGCNSLQLILLVLSWAPEEFRVTPDRLPMQRLTLRVQSESQQQLLVQPGCRVQVQFVEDVSFLDEL